MSTHKRNRRTSPRSFRPRLEILEDRSLLAAITWTGLGVPLNNGNQLWSNPVNWVPRLPANGDDVTISAAGNGTAVLFDENVPSPGLTLSLNSLVSDLPFEVSGNSPGVFHTLALNGTGTFRFNSSLTLTGGKIGGDGTIDVVGPMNWSRTIMFGSGTTNASAGITFRDFPSTSDSRVINNFAAATFIGGPGGFVNNTGNSVFNNLPSGTFIIDGTNDFDGGTFNNRGTFIKRAGGSDGTSRFGVINQTSAIPLVVESGTLQITGGTHTGDFEFTGATLELGPVGPGTSNFNSGSDLNGTTFRVSHGTHNFNAGSTYNVTGSSSFLVGTATFNGVMASVGSAVNISGANVFFNQDVSTTTLSLSGVFGGSGLLAGSGTVNVSGPITWTGGAMGGTGVTNANGSLIMSGNLTIAETRTINNAGAATYNGTIGNFFNNAPGAIFNNLATGTFTIDGNNDYNGGRFNNQGTFTKLAGATGDGVTRFGFVPFTNTGSVTIGAGSTFDVMSPYTQSAGSTSLENGTLTLTTSNPSASFNMSGGILAGSGVINGNVVSAGIVSPGLPTGILTIAGNYTQTPTGSLAVDIGGPLPGTEFDVLSVIGTVTLDGGFEVDLINGFRPGPTDTFPILANNNSDAIVGTFAGLSEGATIPVGTTLGQISYVGSTGNDVAIRRVNGPPTADPGTYVFEEGPFPNTLIGSGSDPDGDPLTYSWDLDNDGSFETIGQQVAISTPDGPSSLTVMVQVCDALGACATSTVNVTVNNVPPTAELSFSGSNEEGSTDGRVSFRHEDDQSFVDYSARFHYAYDFNSDGVFEIGDDTYAGSTTLFTVNVPASFLDDGPAALSVTARIYDKDGGFTTYHSDTPILSLPPTATLKTNPTDEGSVTTVSFIDPFDPSTADTAAGFHYAYDFDNSGSFDLGDGTYVGSVTSATATVPAGFLRDGPDQIVVRARIIDKNGHFMAGDFAERINVNNVAPTAVLNNSGPVNQGAPATVSFSGQFDPGADDTFAGFHYAYDFDNNGSFEIGNGTYAGSSTAPSAIVPASFLATPGGHTARARIIDKDGGFTDSVTSIIVIGLPVSPTTVVWIGASEGGGNWTDPANWAGGVAPTAGDDLVFPSASARLSATNDFPDDTQFNSITFDGGAYTVAGNRLILGDGGLTVNDGNHVLSFSVRLADITDGTSNTLLVSDASRLELSGIVGGARGLHKTGAGALILSGANTYTGATLVSEGVLEVRNPLALGSTDGGTQVCGGARLELQSGLTIANEALTLEDPDPEKGGEVAPGPAVLAIVIGGSAEATTSWDGPIHLNPGNPETRVDEGAAFEVSGVISGVGNLHKTGPGLLSFSGANTYTGQLQVQAGALALRSSTALGSTAAGAELHGGTTLFLENDITVADDLVLVGDPPGTVLPAVRVVSTGTNTVAGKLATNPLLTFTTFDGTLTMAGVISGEDDLVKDGPGALVLAAANTYTGVTRIMQGTLDLRNSAALGATGAGTELQGGTTLILQGDITVGDDFTLVGDPPGSVLPAVQLVSTGNNTVSGKLAVNPLVTVTVANGALTISGQISGNDDLTKDGAGTLVLTADNTLHGAITLLAGTLLVNGSQPNTPIIVQGGVLGGTGLLGPITMNGGQLQGPVIQASPIHPGLHDLVVGGTAGDDVILFLPDANPTKLTVVVNGQSLVRPRPTGHVVAFAGAGNDVVLVIPTLAVPTLLYGESGNDVLWGGWGNDMLFGGAGNDILWGSLGDDVLAGSDGDDLLFGQAGRDILIGGRGSDYLFGFDGDDILIAGTTDFDADAIALTAIRAEWSRQDVAYHQRIAHLDHGGGLNGETYLNDTTVHDDGRVDWLVGSSGRDWFFANLDGSVRDIVTDLRLDEFVDEL